MAVGWAVLDSRADPPCVLQRGTAPILKPELPWEQQGVLPNSVTATGIELLPLPPPRPDATVAAAVFYSAGGQNVGQAHLLAHMLSSDASLLQLSVRDAVGFSFALAPPFTPAVMAYAAAVPFADGSVLVGTGLGSRHSFLGWRKPVSESQRTPGSSTAEHAVQSVFFFVFFFFKYSRRKDLSGSGKRL